MSCFALLSDGRIMSGGYDSTLQIWTTGNDGDFAVTQTLSGHSGAVNCIFELEDKRIITGGQDKMLKLWGITSRSVLASRSLFNDGTFARQALQTLIGHEDAVWCATQLVDGRIVSGGRDEKLKVWAMDDAGIFKINQTLSEHTWSVTCVTRLRDGRFISGSKDCSLQLWSAGDDGVFTPTQTLEGHRGIVWCVTELYDGRIVSGGGDRDLCVWA
jgi:WD40 repeat protein